MNGIGSIKVSLMELLTLRSHSFTPRTILQESMTELIHLALLAALLIKDLDLQFLVGHLLVQLLRLFSTKLLCLRLLLLLQLHLLLLVRLMININIISSGTVGGAPILRLLLIRV